MGIKDSLNEIWDSTEGDEVSKAHAVLKKYFQKANPKTDSAHRFLFSPILSNPKDKAH